MHRLVCLLADVTICMRKGPTIRTDRTICSFVTRLLFTPRWLISNGKAQAEVSRLCAPTIGLTTAAAAKFFGSATRMDKQLAALDTQAENVYP